MGISKVEAHVSATFPHSAFKKFVQCALSLSTDSQ
jgi:hypothetical protein